MTRQLRYGRDQNIQATWELERDFCVEDVTLVVRGETESERGGAVNK